jgi:putative redox protein
MSNTPSISADVVWEGGMSFVARTDSHHFVTLDTAAEDGGQNSGPRPMEAVLCALGGCTAMDVVVFLQKKRRTVEALTVRVTGKRREQPPRTFEELTLDYRVRGPDLTEADIRWAVELSISKYCSVLAMLSQSARVIPRWTLEPSASS